MTRLIPTMLLATRNRGKLREFQALLAPAGWEVIALQALDSTQDADEPNLESRISQSRISRSPNHFEETGDSFGENARLKALHYSRMSDLPVLGDDSGLEVFSLGGRPGIQSARYAGPGATDADRIRKLLAELQPDRADRSARFVCSLALAQWGTVLQEAEGECRGEIALEPKGTGGFGYDPIFFLPEFGCSMAELPEEEKNRISHRARAVASLLAKIARA